MNYDDETLMAYADGELDPALRAEIAAALEKDQSLARRVENHRALRAEVAGAFSAVLDEPVPERLARAAAGAPVATPRGSVLQFPRRTAPAAGSSWRAREWFAMAASVLLGVLVSWRLITPAGEGVIDSANGALVARGDLANALERQLASDQDRDGAVLIGVTFRSQAGGYCRSFVLRESQTAGLACRVGDEWQVPVATAADVPAGGVQQAAGAVPPAVLSAIESRIAGEPLDAGGEESARLGGWAPPGP